MKEFIESPFILIPPIVIAFIYLLNTMYKYHLLLQKEKNMNVKRVYTKHVHYLTNYSAIIKPGNMVYVKAYYAKGKSISKQIYPNLVSPQNFLIKNEYKKGAYKEAIRMASEFLKTHPVNKMAVSFMLKSYIKSDSHTTAQIKYIKYMLAYRRRLHSSCPYSFKQLVSEYSED